MTTTDWSQHLTWSEFAGLVQGLQDQQNCWFEDAQYDRVKDMPPRSIRGSIEDYAIQQGSLKLLQWLDRLGHTWDCETFDYAAKHGHLPILQWLRSRGCSWNVDAGYSAAIGGHLEVLQWLHQHGFPRKNLCWAAARGGHLPVLQWLHHHGYPWDITTCSWAAVYGHLHILQWAREHGCPWDSLTCYAAVQNGHLDVLQWAVQHDCPWDARQGFDVAMSRGQWAVARWVATSQGLIDLGVPDCWPYSVNRHTELDSYQALRWVDQRFGVQWPPPVHDWLNAVAEALNMLSRVLCEDVAGLVEGYC